MFRLLTKDELTRELQTTATEMDRLMARLEVVKERLDAITDTELMTDLGYTETEKNQIRSFGVAMANIRNQYNNEAPLNSDDASYITKIFLPALRVF